MKVIVQSVHFTAGDALVNFSKEKVQKLENYFADIESAEVILREDGEATKDESKIAEIKMLVPGTTLFSSHKSNSFEEALTSSANAVKSQLLTYKGKLTEKH